MEADIRALVLGSGFAGQGHAEALRYCGVEVLGMVSRTQETVEEIANQLNIPYASTNWEQALADLKPNLVAIGTPGGAHVEQILQALEYKAHVFCDKPLAESADKAKHLYEQVTIAGVKTAYAASYRYQPNALYAYELIRDGKIGQPLEIECVSHFNLESTIPFGWSHRAELGGGRLNNNFTHKLSIVEYVLGGAVNQILGSLRNDMHKAPLVSGVHDFRNRQDFIPSDEELNQLDWEATNVEWSYSILAECGSQFASQPVSVMFKHSALHPRFGEDHIVIYGETGSIVMTGCYGQGRFLIYDQTEGWQEQTLPETLLASVPQIEDDTQRNWTSLMIEFTNDIRQLPYTKYQTFEDGARYQAIIDQLRTNNPSSL